MIFGTGRSGADRPRGRRDGAQATLSGTVALAGDDDTTYSSSTARPRPTARRPRRSARPRARAPGGERHVEGLAPGVAYHYSLVVTDPDETLHADRPARTWSRPCSRRSDHAHGRDAADGVLVGVSPRPPPATGSASISREPRPASSSTGSMRAAAARPTAAPCPASGSCSYTTPAAAGATSCASTAAPPATC